MSRRQDGSEDLAGVEARIRTLGHTVLAEVRADKPSVFDRAYYTGPIMDRAMADAAFRTRLFRFVDVLPSLRSGAEVMRHVREYFRPVADRLPGILRRGLELNPTSLAAKAASAVVRRQVEAMGRQFILGCDPARALKALRGIRAKGRAFTVDLLGEACVSAEEADAYEGRYRELIAVLAREMPGWKESRALIAGHPGETTPLNISVKLSALYPHVKPVAHGVGVRALSDRLARICGDARKCGAFVYIDMEDTSMTGITIETVKRVLESGEFRDWNDAGFVFQSYLRRTEGDVEGLLAWLRAQDRRIAVRLVKGAYWDTETIRARLERWPVPVWEEKGGSDHTYEKLTRFMLDHPEHFYPAFGSHNVRSLCHAVTYAESRGLDSTAFELQTLYGMADPVKTAFARRGYLVREYAPVGEMIPGMAYLVRRLLENTSNKGFVRRSLHEGDDEAKLLAPPVPDRTDRHMQHLRHDHRGRFENAPLRDFTEAVHREAFAAAVREWADRIAPDNPLTVRPFICGAFVAGKGKPFTSVSPDRLACAVARVERPDVHQTDAAVEGLRGAFADWRDTPAADRIEVLHRGAELLEARREQLAALMVHECGKPWAEADADVAEAIDFCRYYAIRAKELFVTRALCPYEGEDAFLFYEPRGVCAVIGPWNFPAAIPCGMFAAALVTGNTVALKPAEQAPAVAGYVFRAFLDAGMPPTAAAFLPGAGETGARLVESPAVATIAFTGSREVGLGIVKAGAAVRPGQEHVKRVIAEMGGKNAIIVDADADLDQAVKGILYSAFGYAGQKCSACSRLIVVEAIYDRLRVRLADAVRSLPVGPAADPASYSGPVIDEDAVKRLRAATERAGKPLARACLPRDAARGTFFAPAVYEVNDRNDPLFRDELFGPVLAMLRVESFEAALEAASDSEYGLTGGVFSRSPENLRKAARRFRVGNLYLNRNCTGALVGRQPFGGAKLSGIGTKAGGPDYLLQFVIPRVVTENTLRQGFAPLDDEA